MVAVSSASPSRCFLFWPGRRARIASLIVLATVAIPPTTQPHPLPIRPHAPRRRLGCAAQETMGGEDGRGRVRRRALREPPLPVTPAPRGAVRDEFARTHPRPDVGRGDPLARRELADPRHGGDIGLTADALDVLRREPYPQLRRRAALAARQDA